MAEKKSASKKLPFVIMLLLSITCLAFFLWKSAQTSPVAPSLEQPAQIPPPNANALELFLNGSLYIDRISLLAPSQKEILAKYANEFQICAYFKSNSFLLPVWEEGARTAHIACQANEFPSRGEMSLVNFAFVYENDTWCLDLFSSEPNRLSQIVNLLDHPIGTLLAYFNTTQGRFRSSYILEDVLNKNRLKVSTAPLKSIPWVEYKLQTVSGIEFFENGICRVNAQIVSYKNEIHQKDILLKSLLKKWFLWRKPSEKALAELKPIESIQ